MMKRLVVYILTIVVLAAGCTTEAERTSMRGALDSLHVLNRNDQPFTVQAVDSLVRFFDRHGTPNEQLQARYLLGRAHHLRGEAPAALQCYQNAIDQADTTAEDCDYAQLSRVFSQMAELFYYQGLCRQQLVSERSAARYAWLGKDTLAALMNYEQEGFAYMRLGMPDSTIYIIEKVAHQYKQYGYLSEAAISLGTIVRPLVEQGQYAKAKRYMDIYDSESELFDRHGNIKPGREIYYKTKGLYYLQTGRPDSAEYYFRKELHDGKDFNNQNAAAMGLAQLFQQQHRTDSAAKYAAYAYAMNDSVYAHQTTKAVERIQAMYNYSRFQEIARKESVRAANERNKRLGMAALLLVTLFVAAGVIYKLYADRRKRMRQYQYILTQLELTQTEVLELRQHADEYEELVAEKEHLLARQTAEMQELRRNTQYDHADIDQHLKGSDIYQMLLKKQHGHKLTMNELRECRRLVIENLPALNNLLSSKQYKLNTRDFNVCILSRLGFKSKEISNMLAITQGRVSQICVKILHEVFGEEHGGAAELMEKLHELY